MPELEGIPRVPQVLYVRVHGAAERLVDGHALLGECRRVIDRNLLYLRVSRPVVVEDEQQFLGATQGEHRYEAAPAAAHNLLHGGGEAVLAHLARLVQVDSVR